MQNVLPIQRAVIEFTIAEAVDAEGSEVGATPARVCARVGGAVCYPNEGVVKP